MDILMYSGTCPELGDHILGKNCREVNKSSALIKKKDALPLSFSFAIVIFSSSSVSVHHLLQLHLEHHLT